MGWTYGFSVPRGGALGIRVHAEEDVPDCPWVMVVRAVREKFVNGSLNPLRGRVQVGDLLRAVNHVPVGELGWERTIRAIHRQQRDDDENAADDGGWMHLQFMEGGDDA